MIKMQDLTTDTGFGPFSFEFDLSSDKAKILFKRLRGQTYYLVVPGAKPGFVNYDVKHKSWTLSPRYFQEDHFITFTQRQIDLLQEQTGNLIDFDSMKIPVEEFELEGFGNE